jgi:tetratricopeptide (TPR) repeat protein
VLEKFGQVLRLVGRYDEALSMLEGAARVRHEAGDMAAEGRIIARMGMAHCFRGTPEEGLARLKPMVTVLEDRSAQEELSHTLALMYAALIPLFNVTGRQGEQLVAARRLSELARSLGDERLLAEAKLHHGVALLHLGQMEEGLQILEEVIPAAEGVGDLSTLCAALDFAARVYHARYELDRALAYRERALEVAERLGDPREISLRALHVAWFSFPHGDWAKARVSAERSLTAALSLDSLHAYTAPLLALGELALAEGDWEQAEGYLGECIVIAEHTGDSESLRDAQALLAEKDLLEGHPEAALDRLLPLLHQPGWESHRSFLVSLAWSYLELGNEREAQDLAAKAVAAKTDHEDFVAKDALRLQGMVAARQGHWEEARHIFEVALERVRACLYPFGEGRILYEYALMQVRKGDAAQARGRLEAALAIFRRLGARPYIEQTERAMAALPHPEPV